MFNAIAFNSTTNFERWKLRSSGVFKSTLLPLHTGYSKLYWNNNDLLLLMYPFSKRVELIFYRYKIMHSPLNVTIWHKFCRWKMTIIFDNFIITCCCRIQKKGSLVPEKPQAFSWNYIMPPKRMTHSNHHQTAEKIVWVLLHNRLCTYITIISKEITTNVIISSVKREKILIPS